MMRHDRLVDICSNFDMVMMRHDRHMREGHLVMLADLLIMLRSIVEKQCEMHGEPIEQLPDEDETVPLLQDLAALKKNLKCLLN